MRTWRRSTTCVAFSDATHCTHSYARARVSTASNSRSPSPSRTGEIAKCISAMRHARRHCWTVRKGNSHWCKSVPPTPSGLRRSRLGPAAYPSSEMVKLSTRTRVMFMPFGRLRPHVARRTRPSALASNDSRHCYRPMLRSSAQLKKCYSIYSDIHILDGD